jgi:hypothetical protein
MIPPEAPAVALERWQALCAFLRRWFYAPDLQALEIALTCYCSHLYLSDNPVWLFVIGPPGTGKTSLIIAALSFLPKTHILSDLTTTSFLSGFSQGAKKYSLLHEIGNGVLLFKDFTTMLSKRDEQRGEIVAQLREIHDGRVRRRVGAMGKFLEWEGKITVVAACTPALERAWAVNRDLGDRFLNLRWARGDGIEMGEQAVNQLRHEKEISQGMREHVLALVQPEKFSPAEPAAKTAIVEAAIFALAELTAQMRTNVAHDGGGRISHVGTPEGTTRLVKGTCQLASGRATLFARPETTVDDLKCCRRVLFDSIPSRRLQVMEALPVGVRLDWGFLLKATNMSEGTLQRVLEDLRELGILEFIEGMAVRHYQFSPWFEKLRSAASITGCP